MLSPFQHYKVWLYDRLSKGSKSKETTVEKTCQKLEGMEPIEKGIGLITLLMRKMRLCSSLLELSSPCLPLLGS